MNLSKLFPIQKVLDERIELTQGKFAIVDAEVYAYVSKYKWHYANGYARRNKVMENGKRKTVFMHREIMNTPDGYETDHINGDTLDNRRSNLRVVTKELNQHNSKPQKGKSNFKGVTYYKTKRHKTGYWIARIQVNKKMIRLGYFKSEIEAAIAYNEAAIKYYGPYARLNEVEVRENESSKIV